MGKPIAFGDRVQFDSDFGIQSGRVAMFCRHVGNAEPWAWILIDCEPGMFMAVPVAALKIQTPAASQNEKGCHE